MHPVDVVSGGTAPRRTTPARSWSGVATAAAPAAAVAAASVALAGLSLHQLGNLSVWLDEATTYFVAQLDWLRPWDAIGVEGSLYMSLYFAVLSAWINAGASEAALRLPSVAFAVAAVPAVYLLGRDLFGRVAGAYAAALLSVHAFVIQFAQEARSYSLVLLLTALGSWLLVRAVRGETRRRWIPYVVVMGLGLYAHIFMAFVAAAHGIVALAAVSPRYRGRVIAAYAAVAAAWSPLLFIIVTESARGLDWIGPPTLAALGDYWTRLTGHGTVLPKLALAALVVIAALTIRAHRRGRSPTPGALVLAGVAVPLIGSFLLSNVKPMFVDRYLIVVVPWLVVAGGAAIAALPGRLSGVLALVTVMLFEIQATAAYHATFRKEAWRDVAAMVVGSGDSRDGIIFHSPYMRQPFEYYVERGGHAHEAPSPIHPSPAWGEYGPGRGHGLDLDEALRAADPPDRLWVVISHSVAGPERDLLTAWVEDRYVLAMSRSFAEGVDVHRYELYTGDPSPVVVRAPPAVRTVEIGDTLTLAVRAEGDPPLRYQWERDGEPISGATAPSLELRPLDGSVEGAYRCIVKNDHGEVVTATTRVRVAAPSATYSAAPPDDTWSAGETRSYVVTVTNTGTQPWPAGGERPVRLGVHFGTGAEAPQHGWVTDQRFWLPHDVEPKGHARVEASVTAPNVAGTFELHHRLVMEGVAWFDERLSVRAVVVPDEAVPRPVRELGAGVALVATGALIWAAWTRRRRVERSESA